MRKLFTLFFTLSLLLPACNNPRAGEKEIIVFHAGSLSVPFREMAKEFERNNPGIKILQESAGSLVCARKITELNKPCDIMASADHYVIDELLIPQYTGWGIRFATNAIVIAFNNKSKYSGEINAENWPEILLSDDVIYGRSDPDSDPCGYRSVLTMMLAEQYYGIPGLAGRLAARNRNYIRPKEVDLIALAESNVIDYMFQYKSVAIQHGFRFIELPSETDLSDPLKDDLYATVSIEIAGRSPGDKIIVRGSYINYSLTLLNDAPAREEAIAFIDFILGPSGSRILRESGQEPLIPPFTEAPGLVPEQLRKYLSAEIPL
jgi:molybdate/tungstate transport system substrate-binding protein